MLQFPVINTKDSLENIQNLLTVLSRKVDSIDERLHKIEDVIMTRNEEPHNGQLSVKSTSHILKYN